MDNSVIRFVTEDGTRKTLLLHEEIGKGGYGKVYKATLDGYGYVAAKISVLRNAAKIEEIRKMLYLECDVSTYNLKHSVLLKRYIYNPVHADIFSNEVVREEVKNQAVNFGSESNDCPDDAIITLYDLIDGINLKSDIENHAVAGVYYEVGVLFHYMHCMIKGLIEMVELNIAHRDIKPANFMIQRGRVRYIDFGISCKYTKCPRKLKGTASFTPPEAWRDATWDNWRDELFEKADVYALGRTFCLLFFVDPKDEAFIRTSESDQRLYEFLSENIPETFLSLIYSMMRRDPDDRITASKALEKLDSMRPSLWKRIATAINPFKK